MKPLLRKLSDYIILPTGTNYALDNTSREILDKILKLEKYIQKELPKCKITISTSIKRHDHGKASLTKSHLSEKISDATTRIHINQYNTDKQNLEKKIADVDKKYQIQLAK